MLLEYLIFHFLSLDNQWKNQSDTYKKTVDIFFQKSNLRRCVGDVGSKCLYSNNLTEGICEYIDKVRNMMDSVTFHQLCSILVHLYKNVSPASQVCGRGLMRPAVYKTQQHRQGQTC